MNNTVTDYWKRLKNFGETVSSRAENIPSLTDEQTLAICYLLKLQNTMNAAMILLDRDLIYDAKILSRTLFETMIYLKALAKQEPDFTALYLKDWVGRRTIHYKDLKTHFEGRADGAEKDIQIRKLDEGDKITREFAATIPPDILKKKVGLDIKTLSEKYGLTEQYKLFYQHLHDVTHSLPGSVVSHFKRGMGFVSYPETQHVDLAAMSIFWIYLEVLEDIIDIFSMDDLKDTFNELDADRQANEKAYYDEHPQMGLV